MHNKMRSLMSVMRTRRSGHRVALWLALLAVTVGAADAAAPARKRKARGCVMTQDPASLEQFVSFLREYHQAIQSDHRDFLSAHTKFPLPFASATYEMEAKAKRHVLGAVDGLLKEKETLLWPAVLLPKTAAELAQLRCGEQKCGDPQAPEVPDFSKGALAFAVSGCEVSLTYLASACESETHMVTLRFARGDKGWQLQERAVRMGTK